MFSPRAGKENTTTTDKEADIMIHSKKNESCVTQDKTVYRAKAKFILARIGHT